MRTSDQPLSESMLQGTDDTRRAQVQNDLRMAILDGRFEAGQKLVERELCLMTGASRSILREALVHLEVNGLVERQPHRGFRVVSLNAQNVCEIFELRATLETMAAELFTERASEQEVSDLKAAMHQLAEAQSPFDLHDTRAIKENYYNILFTGCRNVEIRRALENVIDRIYYLRSQLIMDSERREASVTEMQRLTNALADRDRLAARAASLAHLDAARDAVLQRMSLKQGASV